MKINKRKYLVVFGIIIYLFFILLPHVEISAETDSIIEYGYVLEFIDGYNQEGEPTVKQMLEYLKGGKTFYNMGKRNVKFLFPLFCLKDISCISIGGKISNIKYSEKISKKILEQQTKEKDINLCTLTKEPLIIYSKDLYFFRIYADFSNDANFENVYIKKYPWSKKTLYRQ